MVDLLEKIQNYFEIFKNHSMDLNKFFSINSESNDFNLCSCKDFEICALGSQCKVSALVFTFLFGKTTKEIQYKSVDEIKKLINDMPNNSYLHFMIAVHSIIEFVGHRFIIFILKENENLHIFKIQSYVNSYSTRIDKISLEQLLFEMDKFISMFEHPEKTCLMTNEKNCSFWKKFTFEEIENNIEIPNYIHVFNYYQSPPNLNLPENFNELKLRIDNNFKVLIKNPLLLLDNYKKSEKILESTFGKPPTNNDAIDTIINRIKKLYSDLKKKE